MLKYVAALTLTGALALVAATPSQARHGRNAAAIGGFAAGALIGAAAANANNGYSYGYGPDYYAYDYAPGDAYAPAYGYAPRTRYYNGWGYGSDGNCTVSPGSGDYTPCYNTP
jgi:hypothetical protein